MKTKNNIIHFSTKHHIEAIQPYSSDNLIAFYNGRKWGYMDNNGVIIIKPQYEEVCAFKNNLAAVKKKGKWGFVNKQNKTIIPFDYDVLKPVHRFKKFYDYNRTLFCNYEGKLYAPVCYRGRWGFIDTFNKTVIPFCYEDVCINPNVETSKLLCVKANNKWGFIDKKRNTILKFVFDNVRISPHNPNYFTVIQKVRFGTCAPYQNFGLVDSVKGLTVPCKFRCENFSNR